MRTRRTRPSVAEPHGFRTLAEPRFAVPRDGRAPSRTNRRTAIPSRDEREGMSAESPATGAPNRPVAAESEAELDELVAANDLVLVDFYTKGCTLCQSIEPVLGNVARAHEDLTVVLCNPRDDIGLVDRFDVRSVPTLVLFEGGERVGTLADGFQGGAAIDEFVAESRSA